MNPEQKHSDILSLQESKDKVAKENGWNSFDEYYQQGNKLDVLAMMDDVVKLHATQYKEENARLREALESIGNRAIGSESAFVLQEIYLDVCKALQPQK